MDFSEYHDRAITRYNNISEQCGFKLVPSILHEDGFAADGYWAGCRNSVKEDIVKNTDPSSFSPDEIEDSWKRLQATALQFRTPNYEDTSAISHFWLYKVGLEGIVYPSLRNDDFCNYALHPSFVDGHLKLHCVHACFWRQDQLDLHYIGYPADHGTLTWRKSTSYDAVEWTNGYRALMF